ncbi:MAG: hypothetical protein ACE5E6_07115, partial [Phycisphaerae bacterium]
MPPDDAIPTDVAAPDGGAAVPAGDESPPLPDGVTSPPVPDDAAATRAPGEGACTAVPTGDRAWPTVKRRWSVPWGLLTPVGLFVLVIAVFMPALLAGFANWDDNFLIVQQTAYRGFTRAHVEWMFTTSLAGHYQPLTWLSYALDYRIWELEPLGYHLTNVLLHALTTVAFYFVALRLLAIGFGADACSRRKQLVLAAGFAAAVFGVHPLRAESVAWIAERRDVLSGLPLVLSVACYLRYASARSPRAPHARAGGIGAAWPSGGRGSGGL